MIRLYCRKKEGNAVLCNKCASLIEYAFARLDRCPFGNKKSTCKKCSIHCYKPDMKQHIRDVMRWSGPRMILYHPWDAIMHIVREIR